MTVLSLHRISNERNAFWNPIKPETFDQLLAYVKQHYRVIGFNEIETIKRDEGKPYLILSFDDGYYDFYEHALPLLIKHNLPCNHNIVNVCADKNQTIWTERLNIIFDHHQKNEIFFNLETAKKIGLVSEFDGSWTQYYLKMFKALLHLPAIDREEIIQELESKAGVDTSCRMMNWDEIKECAAKKVEIGSHTFSHDSLGTITDHAALEKEILQSKAEIESSIGKSISILALPNGQTGTKADAVISNSDYKFVLYVDEALNPLPLNQKNGRMHISRINLVDEPFPQMALRLELFHEMMRRYVG